MYDEIAEGYNELHGEEQKKKIELTLKNFKLNNQQKILDIGCGTGLSALNKNTVGLDFSFELLKQARIPVVQGIAEQLPFKNKSFDMITSFTAIHNFKDYENAVKEINRVGKEKIIVSVLKKAKNFEKIVKELKNNFSVEKELEEEKDFILILYTATQHFCPRNVQRWNKGIEQSSIP